jgi:mutator protein MutT
MEYWDAYDRFRKPLGYRIRRGDPISKEARHLVVHMVYYNSRGEVLVQRRADDKELAPGLWAFTGGAATAGETSAVACVRETEEEMGFTPDMGEAELTFSYVKRDAIVDVYVIKADVEIEDMRLQKSEVAEARWLNRDELISLARDRERFWQYRYMDMLLRMLDEAEYIWNRT